MTTLLNVALQKLSLDSVASFYMSGPCCCTHLAHPVDIMWFANKYSIVASAGTNKTLIMEFG